MALITNPLSVIKDVRVVLSMLLHVVMLPKLQLGYKFISIVYTIVVLNITYMYIFVVCNFVYVTKKCNMLHG